MRVATIHIMMPNNHSDHQGVVEYLQEKIVNYFGSRNASADPMYPLVRINCDITEDDITYIKDKVQDSIRFTVIVGKENSDKVQGNFICLE